MTFSHGKAVLVTGGAGYIGAHCCKALHAAGFVPVCVDDFSTGHRHFAKWGPVAELDIRDTNALTDVLRSREFVGVMHFAAASQVGESVTNPLKYYDNNVAGTLSLLEAMRRAGCDTIIFSSTGAVYGDVGAGRISEQAAGSPINPYGKSKWMIEQILADCEAAYGLKFMSLRYFNASGADPSGKIGEDRDPETHLIPRALIAMLRGTDDFAIFGDDYPTPDGTAVRDYIHVCDLARAHLLALERLLGGHPSDRLNLGTGRGYSVKEIVDAIRTVTGRPFDPAKKPRRAGDPPVLVADPSRSGEVLGFNPQASDIRNIIETSWRWHQRRHGSPRLHNGSAHFEVAENV